MKLPRLAVDGHINDGSYKCQSISQAGLQAVDGHKNDGSYKHIGLFNFRATAVDGHKNYD